MFLLRKMNPMSPYERMKFRKRSLPSRPHLRDVLFQCALLKSFCDDGIIRNLSKNLSSI